MAESKLRLPTPIDHKYLDVSFHDAGAEAEVYSARHMETGKRVAIKVLRMATGSTASRTRQMNRFVHEARLLYGISDNHIVRVYDVLDVSLYGEPTKAFVMEWLPAQFGDLMNQHHEGLRARDLRTYLEQALLGLGALHANQVAVRDLRPENLLLSEKKVLKLADLGLARTAESAASLLESSRYVAPEILDQTIRRGRAEDPLPEEYFASDLYSLGFIFYEAAVGVERWERLPALESVYGKTGFGSGLDTNMRWREWHVDRARNLPAIETIRKEIDRGVARVLNGMVAKERSERFGTAGEVLQALGGAALVETPLPVSASSRSVSSSDRLRQLEHSRLFRGVAVGLVLTLAIVVAIAIGRQFRPAGNAVVKEEKPSRAPETRSESIREALQQIPGASVTEEAEGLVVTFAGSALFEIDSSTLKGDALNVLTEVAKVLLNEPQTNVVVEGHTDERGSSEYNTMISKECAEAVRGYLILQGVTASRLASLGYGESQPVADVPTEEAWSRNRRIEIHIASRND